MKDSEIVKVFRGVMMLFMIAGSVVLVYNLLGIFDLKLFRKVYVDIFLGRIKNWNDLEIVIINFGVNLLDLLIIVVYCFDGSGIIGVFIKYLNFIS